MKNRLKLSLVAVVIAVVSGCSDDKGLATVDGTTVSKTAYEAFLNLKRVSVDDKEKYQRMLKAYTEREALSVAIDKQALLDNAVVNAEIEEFRRQLLISRYFETFLADAVTDKGIQNFYSANIDKYSSQKVHVSHILLRVTPRMEEPERQALLTTAHELHSKITAGADFSEIAKSASEDKVSAVKGGDLGWVNEGAVSEEFSAKIFSLKEGEVSEPFLTAFGYHIVKVVESPQKVVKPLESVKGDIRYQLRSQAKEAEMARLLESVTYSVGE